MNKKEIAELIIENNGNCDLVEVNCDICPLDEDCRYKDYNNDTLALAKKYIIYEEKQIRSY